MPGKNDFPGVVPSQYRMTPWSRSIPVQKDYPGVILSQDRMAPLESFHQDRLTPLESFHPRTEGHPRSRSI